MDETAKHPAAAPALPARARWIGVLGILCIVLAVAPRFESAAENGVETKTFSLGLPFSPLLARMERVTHSTQDGLASIEASQTAMEFGIPSWSLLSLVLGAGLRAYARKLRQRVR